jgi:hypothetical protein
VKYVHRIPFASEDTKYLLTLAIGDSLKTLLTFTNASINELVWEDSTKVLSLAQIVQRAIKDICALNVNQNLSLRKQESTLALNVLTSTSIVSESLDSPSS